MIGINKQTVFKGNNFQLQWWVIFLRKYLNKDNENPRLELNLKNLYSLIFIEICLFVKKEKIQKSLPYYQIKI